MKKLRLLALLAVGAFSVATVGCNKGEEEPSSTSTEPPASVTSSEGEKPDDTEPVVSSTASDDKTDEGGDSQGGGGQGDDATSDAKTIHEETEPGDFNIYLYTEQTVANREWLYGWTAEGNAEFQASGDVDVTLEGVDENYTFIPFYIDFNKEYEVKYGYNGSDGTGTWSLKEDLSNFFDGVLFKSENEGNGQGSKSDNFTGFDTSKMVKDDQGHYNLYLWEGGLTEQGIPGNVIYYTLGDFIAATDSADKPIEGKDPSKETGPSDYNIYFRTAYGNNFSSRNVLYTWDVGESNLDPQFTSPASDYITLTEGETSVDSIIPFYFAFDTIYQTPGKWDGTASDYIIFTAETLIKTGLFRDAAGTTQTADVNLGTEQGPTADEDGHYNVYVLETSETDPNSPGHNICSVYYDFASFAAAVA